MSSLKSLTYMLLLMLSAAIVSCTKEEKEPYVIERGSVTDVDGISYGTVKIGNHWWMAENLRVSKFNDGTPLTSIAYTVNADTMWERVNSPAYCFTNDSLFGYLYNGLVLRSDKNIAPQGWHVPTDEEWKELEREIGMSTEEANQSGWRGVAEANALTAKYNEGWPANNQDEQLYGSDYFGFNALPAGVRAHDGRTNIQNNSAWWWCSTSQGTNFYYRTIDSYHQRIFRQSILSGYGMSIRCIKD